MNRYEALIIEKSHLDVTSMYLGHDVINHINKIYDDFEKDLKEINNQASRIKKQLAKDHHIECSCSFAKPVACSYVDNSFTFTSCDDCKNKIDGTYQEICSNCKRFYGCYFEKKDL